MDPEATALDRDARLLGLALLYGYVEAGQLQKAAEANSSPSWILAELRRSGALDDPCLEGLIQALKEFQSGPSPHQGTASTHMEPPRHLSDTAAGRAVPPGSWDGDTGRLDSVARRLRQFTVDHWKHYRNLRFIGEGGMGRIYKAQDPDLKRTVALKFLRGQEPAQLKRFLFEAQAQALMDHPNICRVYEISEWQGQHYIAMQYVNGPTMLRAAPGLALEEKLRIGEAVAEAIHAAHRRGLIHRDLKPANVLLEKDDDGRYKPYVLDFGLARELDAPGLTVSGLVLGTTAYISPEQARGEAHHVDRRTDVYGLGATLYELFVGCPPFGEASGMECLRKVLDEEPPPLRTIAPQLPRDLETVVMKCLEKDPSRRYDDAQTLAEDLRRVREGEPIQARPVTYGYRLRRYARRNRTIVAVSLIALIGVLGFAGIAAYTRYTAAVRERFTQHFSQEAERIEALVRFAKLLPAQDIEPHLQGARKRLAVLESEVGGTGRLAAAPGAYAVGRSLLAFNEVDRALEKLKEAERRGGLTPELAEALGRGYGLVYQREVEHVRRMERTEERTARLREIESSWRVPALNYLRQAKGSSLEPHEYLEALIDAYGSHFESALANARAAQRSNPLVYEAKRLEGELLLAQADLLERKDAAIERLELAGACFREARRIAPSDPSLWTLQARLHLQRMNLFGLNEDGAEELQACRRAVQACRNILPGDPSPLAILAQALYCIGKQQGSKGASPEPLFREGLELAATVLGNRPGNLEALHIRILLGNALGSWQRSVGSDPSAAYAQAVQWARNALTVFPGDATLLAAASTAATSTMIFEASQGRDITAAFALAEAWSTSLARRFPDLPVSHERLASLQVERAEFERLHGGDPRPFVANILVALERAAKGRPLDEAYPVQAADAYLIRAQHAFAIGEDAIPDAERVISILRQRLSRPSPWSSLFGVLAEALILRAEAGMERGESPSVWIAQADRALADGLQLDGYYWLRLLQGRSACLKARLGPSRSTHFARSLAAYQAAAETGNAAEAYEGIAWVHLLRAGGPARRPTDLQDGIRAADKALARNPTAAEAHLLRGVLLRSQAADARHNREGLLSQSRASVEAALRLNGNLKRRAEALLNRMDTDGNPARPGRRPVPSRP